MLLLTAAGASAATEQQLLDILNSRADVPAKAEACRELRMAGSAAAVPQLAAMLEDDSLNHAARYALEGIGGPAVRVTLREALKKVQGLNRAGVIASLGALKDHQAVPLIIPALSENDVLVAAAAAGALGNIADEASAVALFAAITNSPPELRDRLLDALLKCAEAAVTGGETNRATRIYRQLRASQFPENIRVAAWRGKFLSGAGDRTRDLLDALLGEDAALRLMSLKVVREGGYRLRSTDLISWPRLSKEAQVAFLEVAAKQPAVAVELVRLGIASQDLTVRAAAWRAAGEANVISLAGDLAATAAVGAPVERLAAREALTRLHGESATGALMDLLKTGAPPVQAEIVTALGARDETTAVPELIERARDDVEPLRSAALDALSRIRDPKSLPALLEIASTSDSEAKAGPALRAVTVILQSAPDKTAVTTNVLAAFERADEPRKRWLLPLLPELGTPAALEALLVETHNPTAARARPALEALCSWPTAAATQPLLEIARATSDPATHSKALRGAIATSTYEADPTRRLNSLREALAAAREPAEKKLALSQVAEVASTGALELALRLLGDKDIAIEAGLAALGVAAKLAPDSPSLVTDAAERVLAQVRSPLILERAWNLLGQSAAPGEFIRDWLVAGPYRQTGADSALAVFSIVFPPEQGEPVTWKAFKTGKSANLLALFPGGQNAAAYLKARLTAPSAADAILLLGSDDGVKAWFNGEPVVSSNVDRGEVADQDKAGIRLKPGTNELMLKVTQGSGGWSACARIVGADGRPVPGLRMEMSWDETAATDVLSPTAGAKPAAKPELPPTPAIRAASQ